MPSLTKIFVSRSVGVWLAGALLLPGSSGLWAQTVSEEGERFERSLEENGQRYELIGSGVFTYMIWTAYAGAYYQVEGETDPQPQRDIPRRLELAYFHDIEADEFAEATTETLQEALSSSDFRALESDLEAINDSYRDVAPGDRYVLSWDGDQLRLVLNGETLFEGGDAAFANAMFGIWLGEEPLGDDFRDALLGR
ncbi:chalcone isomerase family protein [Halomonas sp. CUBES01]|uniref:chalcone isomerase family protein n=1 Tax=Halomonas sp. CUBES01 TaxID=2897340 RepID=UPI001E5B7AF9|nr:chalcone isomerase family protein [Halomonas sp. CUBES01]MEC4768870.1 chalcone isomerase family protein [Halomonas sp. CUBES01]